MRYLDTLVPADPIPQDLLQRLRALGIADAGQRVVLGPLDEATLNLVRRVLTTTDRNLHLELPRGRHDVAVMLGAYLQLMRLVAQRQGQFGREAFRGAVSVIGLNTNLTERLRAIKIDRVSLSEALCAQRIRADGTVTDLRGNVARANTRPDALLYLNTSLGWPVLPGVHVGVAIIDRTSFSNPETLSRALAWAERHAAKQVIVVTNLGEPAPPPLTDGERWLRWAWTPGLRDDVLYELGDEDPCGPLSTNSLLRVPARQPGTAIYTAPKLSQLRRTCLRGIAAARRLNQPFPRPVAEVVQLVNLLGCLWGSVESANVFASMEPRGTTINTLARSLRQARGEDLRGPWGVFRETQWADLRTAALGLTDLLTEYNPRLDVLRFLLEWAAANRPDARVLIRTNSRAAANALTRDLGAGRPDLTGACGGLGAEADGARVSVLPFSDRLPWASTPTLQFHLGVPPPWRRSALLSGEAGEHILVVDRDEQRWLNTILGATDDELTAKLSAAAETLKLGALPTPQLPAARIVLGPLNIDSRGADEADEAPVTMPGIDLDRLFAAFSFAISKVERDEDGQSEAAAAAGGRPVLARALTLEPDGATYWVPAEAQIEVLTGSKYSSVLIADVTAGTRVLLPRGESRDELYQRLLQAAHRDADVMAVQLLLRRFRTAMHELHDRYGSWPAVVDELRRQGSRVSSGAACALWANGTVIAPEDVEDIRRVGRLTYGEDLLVDRTWERIGAIAAQLRQMHRSLGRLLSAALGEAASGQPGPHLKQLSAACGGIDTSEILEEFEVRQVSSVSAPASVPSGQLRRLLTSPDIPSGSV
jgi:hypothetical protein